MILLLEKDTVFLEEYAPMEVLPCLLTELVSRGDLAASQGIIVWVMIRYFNLMISQIISSVSNVWLKHFYFQSIFLHFPDYLRGAFCCCDLLIVSTLES